MNKNEPEKLHEKTPAWFREWHDKAFWHFSYRVEHKLGWHSTLLYGIIIAILAGAVINIIFG